MIANYTRPDQPQASCEPGYRWARNVIADKIGTRNVPIGHLADQSLG